MIDRRALLICSLLCAGGASAWAVHPSGLHSRRGTGETPVVLPQSFGQWRSLPPDRVVLPPADAMSQAAYQQLSVAAYSDGRGPAIVALVAYGAVQTHALQLHRPETCYPSSGFQILSLEPAAVNISGRQVHANWMAAQRGERIDRLFYWTRIGSSFTTGSWDQRLAIARHAFAANPADGVLVRLSVEATATPDTDKRILSFLREWVAALDEKGRRVLLATQA